MNRTTPSVACLRCRKQKLRCTREHPVCRRCERARGTCVYPSPPDRRRLALERARDRSASASTSNVLPVAEHMPQVLEDSAQVSSHALRLVDNAINHAGSADATPSNQLVTRPRNDGPARAVPLSRSPQLVHDSPANSDNWQGVSLSNEVALLLAEIYFERYYEAELLFHKQRFLRDHDAGKLPSYISLAVFAFASLFLTQVPGGLTEGEIGVSEIARADWSAIGQRWAEQASQGALMHADKPCMENVQACQTLALFWFARSETVRTNMHTGVAHRTCRLLQFGQTKKQWPTNSTIDQQLRLGCFWACWLTQCASQENAQFRTTCWADVAGCPLPLDNADDSALGFTHCLDKEGTILEIGNASSGLKLGFNASLVVTQGLWWEVQQFVQSLQQGGCGPSQWASKILLLDQKLESLYDRMDPSLRYDLSSPGTGNTPRHLGRQCSLNYLYHLCVAYLHSSFVPVLSCSMQTPKISRSVLRLAAEQALKHSTIMTNISQHFVAQRTAVSKLWPIVGYGAYVCAAIQLRYFLALRILTVERLERAKVHLKLVGELSDYWKTLKPLHANMKQQFSQAQTIISQSAHGPDGNRTSDDEVVCLTNRLDAALSPDYISTYVSDDGNRDLQSHGMQSTPTLVNPTATPALITAPNSEVQLSPARLQMADISNPTESLAISNDVAVSKGAGGVSGACDSAMREDSIWWSQDPDSLGEVFSQGFCFLNELGFEMDTY
ncbi:hypothetical protein EDB81DRAFT_808764 [Dactylonectria macrodidyma]|uniref:Zn(2)-C6 fungal-type domain-containing protein n=1 Tax=Dactylonectria macrodidyma TaxID=307937 RepID=A0A9P9DZ35_9HYPO|nr:hypothetical protein EDB81DRAFT_808764 [Dactylonectria macrodidyma]